MTLTVNQILGQNIERHAAACGLTLPALATRLCLTPISFSRLRRGHGRFIDPELLLELCTLFECTPNDLLLPAPGPTAPTLLEILDDDN